MEKKYFLYRTTNIKNNKFYIGVHETFNIDDGYLGSGKKFKNSLYYHGKENFKREILEYFDDRKSMYDKEKEIVNEELLKNPKCLNIGLGGKGGFTPEQRKKGGIIAGNIQAKRLKEDVVYKKQFVAKISNTLKLQWKNSTRVGKQWGNWEGRYHSEESKKKMSKSMKGRFQGKENSQFGTCWITNEEVNKKIYRGDEIPNGFRLGRKIKIN